MNSITGIILAGGKSSRMGQDKAFLLFSGRPLIEISIEKMSALFEEVVIVTNEPALYEKYRIKTCFDIFKDKGPLGGIHTGLSFSNNFYNFVIACDMPFLREDLIRYMIDQKNGFDVVVARQNGRYHPLCAVYSKGCIKPIEGQIQKDELRIIDSFKSVKVRIIDEEEVARFDPEGDSFLNVNTPEDHRRFQCERVKD